MPAKKNATSKRGKTATAKVKTTVPELVDVAEASVPKMSGKDALDSTFVVSKDVDANFDNGMTKTIIDDSNGVVEEVGNGDARESLEKINEEADETEEVRTIPKKKGRAKTALKKNNTEEPAEAELAANGDEGNDEPELSPKRPLEESFNEETAAQEPPAKRGREKGSKKAQPASKKARKAKDETVPVGNDDSGDAESSPEEAVTEEHSSTKSGGRAKKGRKEKEDEADHEPSEEKPAAIKKKGRSAVKAGSPETDNSENAVEDVAAAPTKTIKKRVIKEKAVVPEPSTRPTRTRKPVAYGETVDPDEGRNAAGSKKPKKAAPKKAAAATKNATKAGAGAKRKGRVAKEALDEAEEE